MITPPEFPPGTPNWIDLGSPDTQGAAAFYGAVFGWTYQGLGADAGDYGFFQIDGKTVAALGNLDEGATSAWTLYFSVPDADATTQSTEKAGGTVRVQPFDVFDAGRMACLTDPAGAEFAVWQAGTTKGVDVACESNTLLWAELHVQDPDAAFTFYSALYGWRSQRMDMPGMAYTVVSTAEGDIEEAAFGGIAPFMEEGQKPRWVPYFAVDSADETAERVAAAGGAVTMPPEDIPEVGKMAWFTDPYGAEFAVLKPIPPQG